MFDKHYVAPRGGFNANRVHQPTHSDNEKLYKHSNPTHFDYSTRRMFNEWEIETRAERRHPNADGSVNVGDTIKINKRRPYSTFYKYGLIK